VEDEYNAKVPGFRWDIDNYDTSMNEKKNKLSYVENISSLIAPEELKSLKEMTSLQYNTLDALHIVNEESLTKIKDFLYQAIKELG
jgi:hypothetical protein